MAAGPRATSGNLVPLCLFERMRDTILYISEYFS